MQKILDALKEMLVKIDWEKVLFEAYMDHLKPYLEEKVADTESKWDDMAVNALSVLVDKFLKPDAE